MDTPDTDLGKYLACWISGISKSQVPVLDTVRSDTWLNPPDVLLKSNTSYKRIQNSQRSPLQRFKHTGSIF
jgi:hypothetical protein